MLAVIGAHGPDRAAAEEIFLNKNPQSTIKLAQARGVGAGGLCARPACRWRIFRAQRQEIGRRHGGAEKAQVQAMLKVLLPGAKVAGADAADALAVAIADAHMGASR